MGRPSSVPPEPREGPEAPLRVTTPAWLDEVVAAQRKLASALSARSELRRVSGRAGPGLAVSGLPATGLPAIGLPGKALPGKAPPVSGRPGLGPAAAGNATIVRSGAPEAIAPAPGGVLIDFMKVGSE